MFFRKQEPKRRSGMCTLLVGALTTVGACTVISAVKGKMMDMAEGMKQMLHPRKKQTGSRQACTCESEMPSNGQ